jgi:PAS domain S-box-containing protein
VALSSAESADLRKRFTRELGFQEGNITEPGEREMTDRLHAAWTRFQAAPDGRSLDEIVASTHEIIALNQDAMVRKSDHAHAQAVRMSGIMLGVTLAALVLGILSSVYLTNRLTRPVSVLAQAVRRLGQGDLAARARLDGEDEIAQLAGDFNTMAMRLSEYRSSSLGELLEAQQAAQSAIDSLPDPVVVLQRDGRLVNVNRAAESLFGISLDGGKSDPLAEADPAVRELVARMREHVAAGRGAFAPKGLEEAVAVPTRDGLRYILPRANPVLDEVGAFVGATVLMQDVTRLRRFDELKTDLVATVAHEFKTPLTSLRMAIHLCTEGTVGPLTPKQADLLFAARDDCERLQGIVEDLLDLSRIQAGRIELHRRAVSSAALLQEAIGAHRQMARERRVELAVGEPTLDCPVHADPDRLQLVLANLLTNALAHTPEHGQVEVRAALADGWVRFEVRDTGSGIAPEHRPRLF